MPRLPDEIAGEFYDVKECEPEQVSEDAEAWGYVRMPLHPFEWRRLQVMEKYLIRDLVYFAKNKGTA